jgi:hypothetical protein
MPAATETIEYQPVESNQYDNVRYLSVRHEGALGQRMRVPPEELSVRLGSYPGNGTGQPVLLKPRRQYLALGEVSKCTGRNASEFRTGLKSYSCGRRPARNSGKAETFWGIQPSRNQRLFRELSGINLQVPLDNPSFDRQYINVTCSHFWGYVASLASCIFHVYFAEPQ